MPFYGPPRRAAPLEHKRAERVATRPCQRCATVIRALGQKKYCAACSAAVKEARDRESRRKPKAGES